MGGGGQAGRRSGDIFVFDILDILLLLDGAEAHGHFGSEGGHPVRGGAIAEHELGHGGPLGAILGVPAFADGHAQGYGRGYELFAGCLLGGDGHTYQVVEIGLGEGAEYLVVLTVGATLPDLGRNRAYLAIDFHLVVECGVAAAGVDAGDEELGFPRGVAFDHAEILHDRERESIQAASDFDGDNAVAEIAFVGRGDEVGFGERLGKALEGFELALHESGGRAVVLGGGLELGHAELDFGFADFGVERRRRLLLSRGLLGFVGFTHVEEGLRGLIKMDTRLQMQKGKIMPAPQGVRRPAFLLQT